MSQDPSTALAMFQDALRRAPDTELIRYFDTAMTVAELDAATDAIAVELAETGFAPGDRLALYLQNTPEFLIGLLTAWKAGGIAVPINPMYKARELRYLLRDSGARVLLCLNELYTDVAAEVLPETEVRAVITCSARDMQTRNDPRLFTATPTRPSDTVDLSVLLVRNAGKRPAAAGLHSQDPAVLTYTSGTTGEPKGAMNTHANLVFTARTYRDWVGLDARDSILGLAPLFHITGLVGHAMLALLIPAPLVLSYRFHPAVMLDALREHRPTYAVGAITAYSALADAPSATTDDFASLRTVLSGGAPIAPAVADRLEQQLGSYVHNAYGLTETTSPALLVPNNSRAPVDPSSGALSIGVPVYETDVRVCHDDGTELAADEVGELVVSGPQVVPGYWNKPAETAASIPNGALHTGDVGFADAEGWFYLVDRKKDMVNAAGYKVWPREVEDVLYGHPAVRETAVIGVPDEYRGETVKAYVSRQPDANVTAHELIEFSRTQLAAYKYPRAIEFVDELPKTVTGKILRRELRG